MIVIKAMHRAISFLLGQLFGRLIYKKEYFPKGRWFEKWYSIGWTWVMPDIFGRIFLGKNRKIPWPCSPLCNIATTNMKFDVNDLNNFQGGGIYYQAWDAPITLGRGTYIAQNVGLITSNHNIKNLDERGKVGEIILGESCWIGMNAVILPGVELGPHTIVGAGSVVTHSHKEGHVVLAGNPAKIIKEIQMDEE